MRFEPCEWCGRDTRSRYGSLSAEAAPACEACAHPDSQRSRFYDQRDAENKRTAERIDAEHVAGRA